MASVKLWNSTAIDIGTSLFVDSSGNIHVTGIAGYANPSYLRYAVSTDGGATFTNGEGGAAGTYKNIVSTLNYPNQQPSIVVDSAGRVFIFYSQNQGTDAYKLKYVVKSGGAWSGENTILAGDHAYIYIRAEVDADDNLLVATGGYSGSNRWLQILSSVDAGLNWVEEYDTQGKEAYDYFATCLDANQHMWSIGVKDTTTDTLYVRRTFKTEGESGVDDSWFTEAEEVTDTKVDTYTSVAILAQTTDTIWAFRSIKDGLTYKLQYQRRIGGAWEGSWTNIKTNLTNYYQKMQVVRDNNNHIHLFYEIYNRVAIYHTYWNGSTWSSQEVAFVKATDCSVHKPALASGDTAVYVTYESTSPSGECHFNKFLIRSGIQHGGDITEDETWALADSPHYVIDTVNIKSGATVTIEPGCDIKFTSLKGIYLGDGSTYGNLTADGTSIAPITFEPEVVGQYWDKIYVYSGAVHSYKYCTMHHFGQSGGYAFQCNNSAPTHFDNMTIHHCNGNACLYFSNLTTDFIINDLLYYDRGPVLWLTGGSHTITFNRAIIRDYNTTGGYGDITITGRGGTTIFNDLKYYNRYASGSYTNNGWNISNSPLEWNRCLFYDCPYGSYLAMFSTGAVNHSIINCVFDNVYLPVVYGSGTTGGVMTLKNTIFTNLTGSHYTFYKQGVNYTVNVSYCAFGTTLAGTDSHSGADQNFITGNLFSCDPKYYARASKDFHLQSTVGNYTNAGSWVNSANDSPCIDAGDPADAYSNEPTENGDRINMGTEGNTIYASKTHITIRYAYCFDTITLAITEFSNVSLEKQSIAENPVLSDSIFLNVSKEKQIQTESIALSDSIYLWNDGKWLALSDDISLADTLFQNLEREKAYGIESTSLSDAIQIIRYTMIDLSNKFSMALYRLYNVVNKFNFCARVLSNIENAIITVKSAIEDVTNKVNSKRQEFGNIQNDIRTLLSFQVPGDAGVQSLGKSYIKVYINSVEQTDVDVDTISITRSLNASASATFELGRAYDATRPAIESTVEIYYHIWKLYSGYITQITPSDSPEHMTINCQDIYWQRNRTKVYFNVGHKPQDDVEVYYNTIAQALASTNASSIAIGNFIPQTIGLFGSGESDAISSLIGQVGNYSWYYDVNGTPKLWTSGAGDIITIEEQTIGKNLGLYQVIGHQIREAVEDVVNQYRVQMGQKVIRRFNSYGGSKQFASYEYKSVTEWASPDWNSSYETLARNSGTGYGFDYHKSEDNNLYQDVFRKFKMPFLDKNLEEWSDRYDPEIHVNLPFGGSWKCSIPIATISKFGWYDNQPIRDGFTIDYENQTLVFNTPLYLYQTNDSGELIAARAPDVRLYLWKKKYYSDTDSPTQNPTSDIANPLMFFTAVMGSYPTTIQENLNLTNLSIQVGGQYVDSDGFIRYVPSWDDTAFATDYANWVLSQHCDKKVSGTVDITIDAFCYYNIELNKRIMINNILDEALNIDSITINVSSFVVSLQLKNGRQYTRSVSLQSRGE